MSHASTIVRTVIKKNQHFVASLFNRSLQIKGNFPQKDEYNTQGIPIQNPTYVKNQGGNDKDVSLTNAELLLIHFKLKLISYDQATGLYKFNLSITPNVTLQTVGILGTPKRKTIAADVSFDKNNSCNFLLSGKIKQASKDALAMPKIDEMDKDDFVLSFHPIKDITISTQHDIPKTG